MKVLAVGRRRAGIDPGSANRIVDFELVEPRPFAFAIPFAPPERP
jgi:hypothetical protein